MAILKAVLERAIEALKDAADYEAGLSQFPYLVENKDTQEWSDAMRLSEEKENILQAQKKIQELEASNARLVEALVDAGKSLHWLYINASKAALGIEGYAKESAEQVYEVLAVVTSNKIPYNGVANKAQFEAECAHAELAAVEQEKKHGKQ